MSYTVTLKPELKPCWRSGWVGPYTFHALVFDLPSAFGIENGRISKLDIRSNGDLVVLYDRGWDMMPTSQSRSDALAAILATFPDDEHRDERMAVEAETGGEQEPEG